MWRLSDECPTLRVCHLINYLQSNTHASSPQVDAATTQKSSGGVASSVDHAYLFGVRTARVTTCCNVGKMASSQVS